MENNTHDNNWDILGEKIANYVPDEYSNVDWIEMDHILHPPSSAFIQFLKHYALAGIIIIAICSATILFSNGYFDKNTRVQNSTVSAQVDQEIKTTQDGSDISSSMSTQNTSSQQVVAENKAEVNRAKNNIQNQQTNASTSTRKTKSNSLSSKDISQESTNSSTKNMEDVDNKSNEKQTLGIYYGYTSADKADTNISNPNTISYNTENKKGLSNIATQLNNNIKSESLIANTENKVLNLLPSLSIPSFEVMKDKGIIVGALAESMIDIKNVDKRVKFGLQIGLNNSITDYSSLTTSHLPFFGVYANKGLSNKWEVEVGAQIKYVNNYDLEQNYSIDWIDHNGISSGRAVTNTYNRFTSLDIPVVLKYKISNRLRLVGGLRYSYLGLAQIGSTTFSSFGQGSSVTQLSESVPTQGFWNHDFGVILGAEFRLAQHMTLGLRWNQGIRDITPDNLYQNDKSTHVNSDLQLSMNYTF